MTVVPCCPPAGASDELSRQDEPAAAGALRLTPIVLAAAGCCCCCCCLSVLRAACRRDWLDSPRRRCVHGSAGCPILRQVVLGGLNRTEGTALCEQMQVRNRPTHTHTHTPAPTTQTHPQLPDPGQPPTAARDYDPCIYGCAVTIPANRLQLPAMLSGRRTPGAAHARPGPAHHQQQRSPRWINRPTATSSPPATRRSHPQIACGLARWQHGQPPPKPDVLANAASCDDFGSGHA